MLLAKIHRTDVHTEKSEPPLGPWGADEPGYHLAVWSSVGLSGLRRIARLAHVGSRLCTRSKVFVTQQFGFIAQMEVNHQSVLG